MMIQSKKANFSRLVVGMQVRSLGDTMARLVMRGVMSVQDARARTQSLFMAAFMVMFGLIDQAVAQTLTGSGSNRPDEIIAGAVCGANGWLTWFTSLKFLVVILVGGLIGFFIGRAVGKRDNDGIVGVIIAILGLGAIRLLVKVVTTC
ncbi:hypothetical protein [Deinococcus koreensis]|uniref:Uncharacterized protein n=1 Tax=Deinococcus koreensis TaxID=2054903 RepID=A0A2K3URQ1_9DEIO|nr:hypothetical protein [Deinococcus koreensis]PNY79221.1 hypothetical protein CVO96_20100 [Deinococcus koreensis]